MTDLNGGYVEVLGYLAAGIVFLSFCMKTMVSLRITAIASNVAFILYALVADLSPILLLHGSLLPLNVFRFIQMQRAISQANAALEANANHDRFEWLIPLGKPRSLAAGETLFVKGDPAESLFIIIEGELLIPEIGITLGTGAMIGEMSLFTGDSRRTAGARAVRPVELAELTQRRVQELYFDNPQFAYSLVRLITQRLVENLRRAERTAVPAGD